MKRNHVKIAILIVFAITMIFALPGMVNAKGSNVAKIGTTEYATLADAVAVASTDNTETTITLLRSVESGTGFIVSPGQNIIIDFNNYSYDASNPLVGSTGTKTNGCQLLKGAKVTFKNGTLVSTAAKILIQNYCNLTLKDMNISAINADYVSSNNCGTVNIIGNTSITAKQGAFAFDMCWAPNKNYEEGTQITVDTTGTITGNIELGLWGTFSDTNGIKSTLNIKNVNHNGSFTIDEKLKNQLTIEGGTYTADVSKNIKIGYISLKVSDTEYKVGLKATELNVKSNMELVVGKSAAIGATVLPSNTIQKVSYTTNNATVAAIDENGTVKAIKAGEATITVKVGDIVKSCLITVKEEVKQEEVKDEEKKEDATIEVVENKAEVPDIVINNAIEEAVKNDNEKVVLTLKEEGKNVTTAQISIDAIIDVKDTNKSLEVQTTNATITLDTKVLEKIAKNAIAGEKVTLKFEEVKVENLTNKQKETIKNKEVAMVVSAELMVGSTTISNFDGGKATVKIPFTPEKGTEGKDYKIIYVANDGTTQEITTEYEDGYLIVKLNHFSEYVVVKDVADTKAKDSTPKTGIQNHLMVAGTIGVVTLLGAVIINKKNK